MKLISVEKSPNSAKKWRATFEEQDGHQKHTDFGDSSMKDYTQHHNELRKASYQARHHKDLQTRDPTRAGYLSWYILWNKPTLQASISDYKKRFNL